MVEIMVDELAPRDVDRDFERRQCESATTSLICWQTVATTQLPTWTIIPVSSSMGMKYLGGTRP